MIGSIAEPPPEVGVVRRHRLLDVYVRRRPDYRYAPVLQWQHAERTVAQKSLPGRISMRQFGLEVRYQRRLPVRPVAGRDADTLSHE